MGLAKSQEDLAKQINITDEQLRNYKKLNNLIPELQSLVENDTLKATTAYKIWAKMHRKSKKSFLMILVKKKLKKLLATNFGRLKNNPVKQGKVYAEYEKLCGVRQGSEGKRSLDPQFVGLTQEQIAKELGVSTETIRRLKKLQTLSPDLQQLIEDGSVKYTTALNIFSKLPNNEQEKLINEIGQDTIKTPCRILHKVLQNLAEGINLDQNL